jgi:hypothetical protein
MPRLRHAPLQAPVRMIKLTEQGGITPYKWVHPDETLRATLQGKADLGVGALHAR